ncbi:MAG: hypothetical protein Q9214_003738 [Letrouitia sp. 1 TL-2023]
MTFGVTNTNEISRSTDLDWQLDYDVSDSTQYPIVKTTKNPETFWMYQENLESFNAYLSLETFTGYANMQTDDVDFEGNTYSTDNVRAIAASIYGIQSGVQGLSYILGNLSISITNGLRTTSDNPWTISGVPSSFEVYIQIQWAWMIVPFTTVILTSVFLLLTIYVSRQNKIPAWKSSLLAALLSLNTDLRRDLGSVRQPASMEKQAGVEPVRLEAKNEQWQIGKAE